MCETDIGAWYLQGYHSGWWNAQRCIRWPKEACYHRLEGLKCPKNKTNHYWEHHSLSVSAPNVFKSHTVFNHALEGGYKLHIKILNHTIF